MKNLRTLSVVFGVLTLLIWSQFSYADWGHHGGHRYYRYHDHPHYGLHVSAFYPDEYFPVGVGTSRYYYDDGVYYNYEGGNYVVAQPPIGVTVRTIPSDFRPVVINGMTYYTDNGVYYIYTSNGYQVVSAPK